MGNQPKIPNVSYNIHYFTFTSRLQESHRHGTIPPKL